MRIAIVGAGPAGISSLKNCVEAGHECVVFEQSEKIGGTWNYTEETDKDKYGLKVHSAMYEGLRTNLPKELMEFEDFHYQGPEASYITQLDVLDYINKYVEQFGLVQHVKLFKLVENVESLPGEKWKIRTRDVRTNIIEEDEFDAIVICVGRFSEPKFSNLDGIESFPGTQIHSHAFRKNDGYKDKRVLVVGDGPSGTDISRIIAEVSDHVYISKKNDEKPLYKISERVKILPRVKKVVNSRVQFVDGTEEEIDVIMYCTGYHYSYPFLSTNCGIEINDKGIKYLYKHIVNVEHPTMAIMGVTDLCVFPVFGIQIRFFLASLEDRVEVTKGEMMSEALADVANIMELNKRPHHSHNVGLGQRAYMEDLAKTANIPNKVPPVVQKLFEHIMSLGDVYYDSSYRIVNDEEFVRVT